MNISLLIPQDFGIGSRASAGFDRLNLVSTYMSNEKGRVRQILHLFFGGYLRALNILALKNTPLPRWNEKRGRDQSELIKNDLLVDMHPGAQKQNPPSVFSWA
jgi:hypothetical protein